MTSADAHAASQARLTSITDAWLPGEKPKRSLAD
jgi:hypothetical protein